MTYGSGHRSCAQTTRGPGIRLCSTRDELGGAREAGLAIANASEERDRNGGSLSDSETNVDVLHLHLLPESPLLDITLF